jgi:hypothetical protein
MANQELHLDTSETGATEHRRSKKTVPLIASAAMLVILAAIGVYYVAFRSLPTTVSWAPSVSAIAPGGELTVAGRVAPAESGRLVSFESAPTAQGPWQPMPQSATTDPRGRFSITYKPQLTGSIVMRVVVDPTGRYLAVTGQSISVRLLTLSSVSLKGGGNIPTKTALKFTVAVDPPGANRTVRIEQSSDKVRWVPVGPAARTQANGTSVVSVPGPAVGSWSYRATVAQDDKFAAAVSPVVAATVEDIKAAAATYIRIINKSNAALDAFNKAVDRSNVSPGFPAYLRTAAATYSAAETKAAAELRAYGAWPLSVKPLIDQVIAQFVIAADYEHQLSAVTSTASWNKVQTAGEAAAAEGARVSTLIRQALGLPQRPTG